MIGGELVADPRAAGLLPAPEVPVPPAPPSAVARPGEADPADPVRAVHGGAVAGRRAPVRLTRRGRLVVLTLLVLLFGAVTALVALPSQAAGPAAPTRVVVVQPGDSLWTIVDRYRSGADPVRAMDELSRANGLSGSTLYPGEELTLPANW